MAKPWIMLAAAVLTGACASRPPVDVPIALVEFINQQGVHTGTASVFEMDDGIRFVGTIRSLPPGPHGFHIHAVGRCEPPFASAGGHFNPTDRQHGLENPSGPHVGDLPNIIAAANGEALFDVTAKGAQRAGAYGVFDADGAALVVHASADDQRTDPAGNSGNRIMCGVLTRAP